MIFAYTAHRAPAAAATATRMCGWRECLGVRVCVLTFSLGRSNVMSMGSHMKCVAFECFCALDFQPIPEKQKKKHHIHHSNTQTKQNEIK